VVLGLLTAALLEIRMLAANPDLSGHPEGHLSALKYFPTQRPFPLTIFPSRRS
jgi:hypothetical protein